jgi:transcription elongation factor
MVLVKGLQQGQAIFQPGDPVPALQRRGVGGEGVMGDMAASRRKLGVVDNPENDRLSNEK